MEVQASQRNSHPEGPAPIIPLHLGQQSFRRQAAQNVSRRGFPVVNSRTPAPKAGPPCSGATLVLCGVASHVPQSKIGAVQHEQTTMTGATGIASLSRFENDVFASPPVISQSSHALGFWPGPELRRPDVHEPAATI
jgi:hypothetical protein